jgi:hypothetical protein
MFCLNHRKVLKKLSVLQMRYYIWLMMKHLKFTDMTIMEISNNFIKIRDMLECVLIRDRINMWLSLIIVENIKIIIF